MHNARVSLRVVVERGPPPPRGKGGVCSDEAAHSHQGGLLCAAVPSRESAGATHGEYAGVVGARREVELRTARRRRQMLSILLEERPPREAPARAAFARSRGARTFRVSTLTSLATQVRHFIFSPAPPPSPPPPPPPRLSLAAARPVTLVLSRSPPPLAPAWLRSCTRSPVSSRRPPSSRCLASCSNPAHTRASGLGACCAVEPRRPFERRAAACLRMRSTASCSAPAAGRFPFHLHARMPRSLGIAAQTEPAARQLRRHLGCSARAPNRCGCRAAQRRSDGRVGKAPAHGFPSPSVLDLDPRTHARLIRCVALNSPSFASARAPN